MPAVPDDGIKLHNQYDYFPDGRLKKLNDLDDHDPSSPGVTDTARWFSRVYTYDNRGRILKAKGWNPNGYEFDFPFEQYYSYDSSDHMTSRSGSYYYQPNLGDSGTFVNNRRQGWGSLGSSFGSAQERGCTVDGVPTNCDRAMQTVNCGTANVQDIISRIGRQAAMEMGYIDQYFYEGSDRVLMRTPYFLCNFGSNPQNPTQKPLTRVRCKGY